MLKFGIIGMNSGNGHPYSYASVFNGFDPEKLRSKCPFALIKEYLPAHHRQIEWIPEARVTHIWTQERALSESVAGVANIPHIVDRLEDMIGEVDGVLFTRDDMWNHYDMALPFLEAGLPVYMDKLLASDGEMLDRFIAKTGRNYPVMTNSSFRYARTVSDLRRNLTLNDLRIIHGTSANIWVRYAPHLLDPIMDVVGSEVKSVIGTGNDAATTGIIEFESGVTAVLQVVETLALPLGFRCYSNTPHPPLEALYTDPGLESYFLSIKDMMREFTRRVSDNAFDPAEYDRSVKLNKIVLAVPESRSKRRPINL